MDSTITDEERKRMEEFIRKHPPYEDDDPILQWFDNTEADPNRIVARMYKGLLDGRL